MIPISDDNPVDHTPFMTWLLILAALLTAAWIALLLLLAALLVVLIFVGHLNLLSVRAQ